DSPDGGQARCRHPCEGGQAARERGRPCRRDRQRHPQRRRAARRRVASTASERGPDRALPGATRDGAGPSVGLRERALARALRILLIEDDREIARALLLRLKAVGHDPFAMHEGGSGLAAALTTIPDLIVLDLRLPDMDG